MATIGPNPTEVVSLAGNQIKSQMAYTASDFTEYDKDRNTEK